MCHSGQRPPELADSQGIITRADCCHQVPWNDGEKGGAFWKVSSQLPESLTSSEGEQLTLPGLLCVGCHTRCFPCLLPSIPPSACGGRNASHLRSRLWYSVLTAPPPRREQCGADETAVALVLHSPQARRGPFPTWHGVLPAAWPRSHPLHGLPASRPFCTLSLLPECPPESSARGSLASCRPPSLAQPRPGPALALPGLCALWTSHWLAAWPRKGPLVLPGP